MTPLDKELQVPCMSSHLNIGRFSQESGSVRIRASASPHSQQLWRRAAMLLLLARTGSSMPMTIALKPEQERCVYADLLVETTCSRR